MNKHRNKLTSRQSPRLYEGKSSLILGGFIVLTIISTPFIFYSYNSFPADSKVWETILFTFTTENYPSIYHFMWFFMGKLVPIMLLAIWFFTCRHWWHWIILLPLAMYVFQIVGVIKQNKSVDELEIYYILPIMMVLVPAVYLIRAKLFDKIRGDDPKEFEKELSRGKLSFWEQMKDLFH